MSGYVLYYVAYETNKNATQRPQINEINVLLVDSNLANIKNRLVESSAAWIKDEIGKNNYVETLDNPKSLAELPDGLVRQYAHSNGDQIHQQIGGNIIKQINIFKKTSSAGRVYGKWIETELVRSYMVAKSGNLNLSYREQVTIQPSKAPSKASPSFDAVIGQLKAFDLNSLKCVKKEIAEADKKYLMENLRKWVPLPPPPSDEDDDSSFEQIDDEDDDDVEDVEDDQKVLPPLPPLLPPPPPPPLSRLPPFRPLPPPPSPPPPPLEPDSESDSEPDSDSDSDSSSESYSYSDSDSDSSSYDEPSSTSSSD